MCLRTAFFPHAGCQEPWPSPRDSALLLLLSPQASFVAPREHVLSLSSACLQEGSETRHNPAAAAAIWEEQLQSEDFSELHLESKEVPGETLQRHCKVREVQR